MLLQRLVTAAVGLPVVIAVVLAGGALYAAVVALILAVATLEFAAAAAPTLSQRGLARAEIRPAFQRLLAQQPLAYVAVGLVGLMAAAAYNGADWWAGSLVLGVFLALLWLIITAEREAVLDDWLWVVGALAYIGFLGTHLVLLREVDNGRDWVLLALLSTFATDTAAYFCGKTFGRHKLAPRTSPGKTVEGTIGGLIAGALMLVFFNWALGVDMGAAEVAGLALLLPIVAVIGDLGESLLKRGAGIKDASALVPGHGGFLDRLDSVLFCIPLVYYYLLWVVE